jgi:hypothetical protein
MSKVTVHNIRGIFEGQLLNVNGEFTAEYTRWLETQLTSWINQEVERVFGPPSKPSTFEPPKPIFWPFNIEGC